MAEVNAKECLASARLLMEKLYRRNPREWRKGNFKDMEAAMARAFDPQFRFRFAELGEARGADAIVLALKPEYSGDRVFAFGVGLASMVLFSYNGKTEFYLTDSLDAQKLYNSARNIEIAAWKLGHARDARGELLILSNEAVRRHRQPLVRTRVRKDDRLPGRDGADHRATDEPDDTQGRPDAGDRRVPADLARRAAGRRTMVGSRFPAWESRVAGAATRCRHRCLRMHRPTEEEK